MQEILGIVIGLIELFVSVLCFDLWRETRDAEWLTRTQYGRRRLSLALSALALFVIGGYHIFWVLARMQ